MLIPGKSERPPPFYCPTRVLELQARQFTSIAVITSWDFETLHLYLDSGAMYRAVGLKALRRGIALSDERALSAIARETHVELKRPSVEQEAAGAKNCVFLDGVEVTDDIRTEEVAQAASRLATIQEVREVLVAEQQRAGAGGGIVMEGRDIGTVVFPDAELKR